MHRHFALALLLGTLVAACAGDKSPLQPSDLSTASNLSSVGASSAAVAVIASEVFEFGLAYEGPAQRQLASSNVVEGSIFALDVEQRFDLESRVLDLTMRLENRGAQDLWRSIRIEMLHLRPAATAIIQSDNNQTGIGAQWDFGQVLGGDGKLATGEVSGPRLLRIQTSGLDAAHLNSIRLALRVEGSVNPRLPPSPMRDPTAEEVNEGFATDILLIRYKGGALTPSALSAINLEYDFLGQDFDVVLEGYIGFIRDRGSDRARALRDDLEEDPRVEFASLAPIAEVLGSAEGIPDMSEVEEYQLLENFGAAWREDKELRGTTPGEGVVVGVMDTGIDRFRAEFIGQVAASVDARYTLFKNPLDEDGHGTGVAGIIAASANGQELVGGAYGAKLYSIKVMGDVPSELLTNALFFWNLKRGLQEVADHPEISILNTSIGFSEAGFSEDLGLDDLLDAISDWGLNDLLAQIWTNGTLIVAAAGNCGSNDVNWPANRPEVIAVGGTNASGTDLWKQGGPPLSRNCGLDSEYGSNYGPEIEIAAIADGLAALRLGGGREIVQGTSYAAPQVAAAAAILKSRLPSLGVSELREALRRNVLDLGDIRLGGGLLDLGGAADAVSVRPVARGVDIGERATFVGVVTNTQGFEIRRPLEWTIVNPAVASQRAVLRGPSSGLFIESRLLLDAIGIGATRVAADVQDLSASALLVAGRFFEFGLDAIEVAGNVPGGFVDDFNDGEVTSGPTSKFHCLETVREADGLLILSSRDGANDFTHPFLTDNCGLGLRDPSVRLRDGSGSADITAYFRGDVPAPGQSYGLQLFTLSSQENVNIQVIGGARPQVGGVIIGSSGEIGGFASREVDLSDIGRVLLRLHLDDGTNLIRASFSTDEGASFVELETLATPTAFSGGNEAIVSVVGSVTTN